MTVLAMLKKSFRAEPGSATVVLLLLVVGCWSLVDAEWSSGALSLSVSAVIVITLRGKLWSETEHSAKWETGVLLTSGIAQLGVACANAVTGDLGLAVLVGLAGTVILIDPCVRWLKQTARRAKSSI